MSNRLEERLPDPVTSRLSGTAVEVVYDYIRARTESFQSIEFRSHCGRLNVEIPASKVGMYDNQRPNTYEPVFTDRICQSLSDDDVFYDVGSHWGLFAVLAETCGVQAENIHRFESDLYYYLCDRNRSTGDVNKNWMEVADETVSRRFGPDRIRLDDYGEERDPPSIIKMDIQGAEYLALEGLSETFDREHPELFVEVHPNLLAKSGHTADELIHHLDSKGYRLSYAVDSEWSRFNADTSPEKGEAYYLHAV